MRKRTLEIILILIGIALTITMLTVTSNALLQLIGTLIVVVFGVLLGCEVGGER